jgi:SARP family transcriptional regulator, regulator of embCAB operon
VEIKVLGPLEAQENGRQVVPTASRLRQIMALLALESGQVVTVPTLIEDLSWFWMARPSIDRPASRGGRGSWSSVC